MDLYPNQDPLMEENMKWIKPRPKAVTKMMKPIIDQKEVRYFDKFWFENVRVIAGNNTLLGWKWYLNVFDQQRGDEVLRGEASPTYFTSGKYTADKIKQWLPEVKLILLLRNPIERFISHLNMLKTMREEMNNMLPRRLVKGNDATDHERGLQGFDGDMKPSGGTSPFHRGGPGGRHPVGRKPDKNDVDDLRNWPKNKQMIQKQICSLSIYQIILLSNANGEASREYYLEEWALGPGVPKMINKLLDIGLYDKAMAVWLEMFDEKHFFFRDSNEFFRNPVAVMQDLEKYLAVDPLGKEQWDSITSTVYNVKLQTGAGFQHRTQTGNQVQHWDISKVEDTQIRRVNDSVTMKSQEVIGLLRDYYRPHNIKLSELIGGKKYEGWDY